MRSKLRCVILLLLFVSGTLSPGRAIDTYVDDYLGGIGDTIVWGTSQEGSFLVGLVSTDGSVLSGPSIALIDSPTEFTSDPPASGFSFINGSGVNDTGASVGVAQGATGPEQGSFPGANNYATGSSYNPSTQQHTDIVSSNSLGTQIAQGINAAAQVTGSSQNSGFTRSQPASLPQPKRTVNPFQVSNTGTPARAAGINDSGVIARNLNKAGDVAMDTVGKGNDKADQVTGHSSDSAGNAPDSGASPASLPCDTTSDSAYVFCVDVIANGPVFLDPVVAIGYDYAIGNGDPFFATVTLPIGIGDSLYTLDVGGDTFSLAGGELFDFRLNGFPNGVAEFEVLGIETGAMLDPSEPAAFVTEVTFTGAGQFTGTMTPIIAQVPEPSTLALFGLGIAGLGLVLRRKSNESSTRRFS